MAHDKEVLAEILRKTDLGNSVAEHDELLWSARIETSVYTDLLADRVDLIPGTKGSGKSALFRMFTDYMPDLLLQRQRIAVAHGVYSHGDSVFGAFGDDFNNLTENQFVDFWCIYFIKIAYSDFIKNERYQTYFTSCRKEIADFERMCSQAGIPSVEPSRTLYDLLESVLGVLSGMVPARSDELPHEPIGMDSAVSRTRKYPASRRALTRMPRYVNSLRPILEDILKKSALRLWLMVDRLDELFPRRSEVETRALRGLLRMLQEFSTKSIRIKLFLRDDILSQVTASKLGFTALTHVAARQADRLRWSEDQILNLIVKRLFASEPLSDYLKIKANLLSSDRQYRLASFYTVFPKTVQGNSPTLRWIYEHTIDGQGVVTPRDVIELLTRAKQRQEDEFNSDSKGRCESIISSKSLTYGFEELSQRKKDTLLRAEYPHLWDHIQKFEHGKSDYTRNAVIQLLGVQNSKCIEDLVSIGFLHENKQNHGICYRVPHVYRRCLDISQGWMN